MVGVENLAFLPQWRNCHVNSWHKYPFSAVSSLAPLVLYCNTIWPIHPCYCYPFVLFLQKINIFCIAVSIFHDPRHVEATFFITLPWPCDLLWKTSHFNEVLQLIFTGQALRHVFWGISRHAFTTETQGAGCHCTAGFLWSHWHRTKG